MLISINEAECVDIEAALLYTIKHARECGLTYLEENFRKTLDDFRDNVAIAKVNPEKGENHHV